MININEIKQACINLNKNASRYLSKEYKKILLDMYCDLQGGLLEAIYRIINDIEKVPTCPICSKPVKWVGGHKKYLKTCNSKDCVNKYKYIATSNAVKEKYGVDNVFSLQEVRNKIINTCNKIYGDSCNSVKGVKTRKELYGSANNYNKILRTCLEKYGVSTILQLEKNKKLAHTTEAINKMVKSVNNTKRKNGTFNTSKPEENCYLLIKTKFPDVVRQYRSEVYPFNCDFYIPSLDLYIEYNGMWTHGEHPYNENSEEDKRRLLKMINKHSKFYDSAIKVWTKSDPLKRETAKKNNLNFIEFWSIKEVEQWIENQE